MPRRPHHTDAPTDEQLPALLGDAWATEVVPTLPDALALQATHLRAMQRIRRLDRPADLLRALPA